MNYKLTSHGALLGVGCIIACSLHGAVGGDHHAQLCLNPLDYNTTASIDGTMLDSGSNDTAQAALPQTTCNVIQDFDEENSEATSEASLSTPAPRVNIDPTGSNLGMPQHLDSKYREDILERLEEATEYMETVVHHDDKYESVRSLCQNKHESCAFWSIIGECEKNPGYMKVNCAPVCKSCEMLHIDTRCPMDPAVPDALYPGDVNRLFERIISSPEFEKFEPVVVSRPPEGPWLLMFENVINAVEAQVLINFGAELGYERSADVGKKLADGTYTRKTYSGRTSTNAWCLDECYEDPVAQRIMQRIEDITGIPEVNSENLQLLQYEKNQFYNTHTDYIDYQVKRPTGVRVLTFYMYLNDVEEGGGTRFPKLNVTVTPKLGRAALWHMYLNDVEEGGGTRFPKLNVTVTPKLGRAALWPSVLDSDPNAVDRRTDHEAMPVIRGVKYGANAWIHQRDFKTNNVKGC
eukprot:CAMPEP_0198132964 /NCGR_PEP_ID=MMETSP1442-20131203/59318_1 /TAXON_ID= /ORGANISM="Craspedostauros australis, Strain CCMP3328" /LENGTH=463 /DNA_ID=CAMNT_0043794067 /DNA_START=427 /DNA_END=1819 /DNA_ORIENTATION=+